MKNGFRAQFFSLTALIFVLLMILTLLLYVVLGLNYDNISESNVVNAGSQNYGHILTRSADTFAEQSATAALSTLFNYEYNSSLRQSNFISNTSLYMRYLITNGTLPNVLQGSTAASAIKSMMGGATFASYNSEIAQATGIAARVIYANETKVQVLQSSPYSLSVRYTETVFLNTSSGTYAFSIPVNASVSLNNTPDLFYAQQGVYKPIKFGNLNQLVTFVGNSVLSNPSFGATGVTNNIPYAFSGNTMGFAYGTIYVLAPLKQCSAISASFETKQYILATADAGLFTSGSCQSIVSKFAGIIAANMVNFVPAGMPYLNYTITGYPTTLQTGDQLLLYGPSLATLNITNLIGNVSNEYYFTAPLTPQYIDRVDGNFTASPNGMFTLFSYDRQAAVFGGIGSSIITGTPQPSTETFSVAAWVYPTSQDGLIEEDHKTAHSSGGHTIIMGIGDQICNANGEGAPGEFFFGDYNATHDIGIGVQTPVYPTNSWYFVVGTFNSIKSSPITLSDFTIYVNGQQVSSTTEWACASTTDTSPLVDKGTITIGNESGFPSSNSMTGDMANIQIYDQTLTPFQVFKLYEEGIEGLPLSNSMLLGWYPLNGNSNDYSGQPNGQPSTVSIGYSYLPNYQIDNILGPGSTSPTYPIPGLHTCTNNWWCSNGQYGVYVGTSPLSTGGETSAAYFDGQSSIYNPTSSPFNGLSSWTFSGWINPEYGDPSNEIYGEGVPQTTLQIDLENNKLELAMWNYGYTTGHPFGSTTCGPSQLYWVCAYTGPIVLAPNVLNHIVITMSGAALGAGTARFYVNGQLVATNTVAQEEAQEPNGDPNGHYMGIGFSTGALGLPTPQGAIGFLGQISDVQLYNAQLSSAQVSALYQEGPDGAPVQTANVLAWYPLYQNANDYGGQGLNGISSNIAYQFIPTNYSQPLGTLGEWQALGFPSPP